MFAVVILVVVATTLFTLFVRAKDIPAPEPVSPTQYLEDRKAAIYENLRDLQFEYRVGKLSDADYQSTKVSLQKELAVVLAEIDRVAKSAPVEVKAGGHAPELVHAHAGQAHSQAHSQGTRGSATAVVEKAPAEKTAAPLSCPHCGAKFAHAMKFCGECGKAMAS